VKALVFGDAGGPGLDPEPGPAGPDAPRLVRHLATTPMRLREVPDPEVKGPEWAVLRTRLCGICGSDTKQVLMDFEDGGDSPMTAFISFPQVLGHEVVATVEEAGPALLADGIEPGQRVVLNPWLSCAVRGLDPCPSCQAGDYQLCWHFHDGALQPGIHTGNAADATGGFAEYLPAHRQMLIPVPDGIPDEVAVLADPFSVALHAVTRNPPPPGGRAVVYGAGALGTCATAILGALHPDVDVATVARWDGQAALANALGATVVASEPRDELVVALADWSGGILRQPWEGLPVAWPGGVDVVYDTVGAPETVEVALRVLRVRGTIVEMGLSSMGRCEWTPWYFKEARLIGSNAFGVEEVEGVRQHAIAHYLDLVAAGRIDVSAMLTHRFALPEWRAAFQTLIDQGTTGAVKVAFDFR
jgi:threonine dehydrogenase-like Zn-dependent dehydrogenase